MAGDDDEMFMTSLDVTPKTTEQPLIARSDKSIAQNEGKRWALYKLTCASDWEIQLGYSIASASHADEPIKFRSHADAQAK